MLLSLSSNVTSEFVSAWNAIPIPSSSVPCV